jgi:hypothetical protein
MAALEAAQRPGARVAEPATPASKLLAAALQDNDRFLASEGDQQQLLMRCARPRRSRPCRAFGNPSQDAADCPAQRQAAQGGRQQLLQAEGQVLLPSCAEHAC